MVYSWAAQQREWLPPGLLLTSKTRTAPRRERYCGPAPGCSWDADDLRKRTAPRRERYFDTLLSCSSPQKNAPRLNGNNIWLRLDESNVLKALACSGSLVDTFKFHQIWCHFGVPVPRGLGHDNDGRRFDAAWRRGLRTPALERYLSAFRAPTGVKVRTTEVSS